MNRFAPLGRSAYFLTLFIHASMLSAVGGVLGIGEAWNESDLVTLLVVGVVVARSALIAQLPKIAMSSKWLVLRPMIVFELVGLTVLTAFLYSSETSRVAWVGPFLMTANATFLAFVISFVRIGSVIATPAKFFLFARGHFDDWSARRQLFAFGVVAATATAVFALMLRARPEANLADLGLPFAIAMGAGIALPFLQVNPIRTLGFLPWAILTIFMAAIAHAITSTATWPIAVLGFGAGLGLPGLITALIMLVPPRQRFAALLFAHAFAIIGGFTGFYFVQALPDSASRWIVAAVCLAVAALLIKLYFRELVELIMEAVYWPMYRFKSRGPGLTSVPTRGPVLIIANHGAFFDPLFIAKVLPLRVRALMISTMFDRPFLKWLAGDVYGAIRVPDAGAFRRETPELDEGVAVLKRGENLMIFPEAWLRRKEEKPIHRFAQGVFRILREVPDTLVLPVWIENSWGSYVSYKNGPPGQGKKFDIFYPIQMGFSEPLVVPPAILEDQRTTRRYLMELVLEARTHLGLPAYPLPAGMEEDKSANDAG